MSVLPRLFEVVGSAVELDEVDGATLLGVRRHGLSRSSGGSSAASTSSAPSPLLARSPR